MLSVGKAPPRRAMVKCRTGGSRVSTEACENKAEVVRMREKRKCMILSKWGGSMTMASSCEIAEERSDGVWTLPND